MLPSAQSAITLVHKAVARNLGTGPFVHNAQQVGHHARYAAALRRKEQALMSTYPAPDLLRLWVLNKVTPGQTLGHLLQHLVTLTQRLEQLTAKG